jgi:hypothetical protein
MKPADEQFRATDFARNFPRAVLDRPKFQ